MNDHPKTTVAAEAQYVVIRFMQYCGCGEIPFVRMLGHPLQKRVDEYRQLASPCWD